MQEAYCLLRRHLPYKEESLAGFLLRLAESNCYDSVRWIFQLAKLFKYEPNANLLIPTQHNLFHLSCLTGIEESLLWKMAFPPIQALNGNYVQAFDQIISRYFVHKSSTKVCPYCLGEIPFRRKIWDLSIVTTCPKHKCLLIDVCPKCQKVIFWSKTFVTRCKCGFDFCTIKSEGLADPNTFLSLQIHNLCHQIDLKHSSNLALGLNSPIFLLELQQLLTLITFLAGQFVGICDATGKVVATRYRNAELHLLLMKSLNLLVNWPDEFYKFLDWRRSLQVEHDRATGIVRDFGSFYKKLYTNFSAEPYSFLRDAFEEYLAKFWNGGYLNTKLGRLESPSRTDKRFVSGSAAANVLSLSEAWVLKLVEQGVLVGNVKEMGTRTLILVERESVNSYRQLLDKSLTLKDVANLLGTGHRTVIDLVDHSCIKALRGPKSDGYRQWLIDSESVENFLQELSSLSSHTLTVHELLIPFSLAVRKTSGLSYTVGKLMRLVLDKTIEIYQEPTKTGLEKYYFVDREINELIQQATSATKNIYLTVIDVANLLKIKQEVVRFWADKGLIECKQVIEGKHCRRQILMQDFEVFQLHYVTAAELATHLQTSPRRTVQLLAERQILPITGPSIDGGRQYLFRRNDAMFLVEIQSK